MNIYEWAPLPPKVRVTKKQLKQIQKNYELAQKKAADFSEQERLEKERAEKELEEKLKNII
jgi:hypothetical protein